MRLVSNKTSIERGEPSWLAITETLLATLLFWSIAWRFDTYLHLLISISVVPLLLSHASKSAEKEARWFAAYLSDKTEITPLGTPLRFWCLLLPLIFAVTAICTDTLAQHWLPNHSGWSPFARAMLLGVVAMWIAITIAVAFAMAGAVIIALVVALALAMAVAETGVAPAALGLAMTVTLAAVLAIAIALALLGTVAGEGEWIVALLLAGLPWILGIWLRAVAIRIKATLHHPLLSLHTLPSHWRKNLWVIDSWHPPNMVPGSHALPSVFSPQNIQTMIHSRALFDQSFGIVLLLLFFFPTLLDRWSLKSTVWFYWPLIYLLSEPRDRNNLESTAFLSILHHAPLERLRRWSSLAMLAIMTATTFSAPLKHIIQSFPHIPARLYQQAFDLNLLTPWQGCCMISILFTGFIHAYSNAVRKSRPSWLLWMVQIRSLNTVTLLLLSYGYTGSVLYGITAQDFHGWLSWLKRIGTPYL